ncbi:hypothetical protein KCP73_23255 [Salmonella enterica subsp. enterica]|nr:hypothetical protein KCP73_23255 [Salmonella enterica subsp. enterica]
MWVRPAVNHSGHPVIGEGGPITVPEGGNHHCGRRHDLRANPGDPPTRWRPLGD